MKTVVLCQPKMGYYDKVARDLPAALLASASYVHEKYEVIIVDMRVQGWKNKLKEALNLIVKILKDNSRASIQGMGMVVPYPGTPYLAMAKKEGLKEPEKIEDWINYNPDDWIWHNPLVDEQFVI